MNEGRLYLPRKQFPGCENVGFDPRSGKEGAENRTKKLSEVGTLKESSLGVQMMTAIV